MRRARRIAGRAFAAVTLAAVPVVILAPTGAGAVTAVFTTVGTSEWIVPDGVSCVTATAIGAEGGVFLPGATDGAVGGSGSSTFPVVAGLSVQINVGGRGGDAFSSGSIPGAAGEGGINGGGAGGLATIDGAGGYFPGAGGGGASDVRAGGTDLDRRVVVGGGGGGSGGFGSTGRAGVGGGDDGGTAAVESDASGGSGGSPSAGGTGGSTDGVGKTGADGAFGVGGTGGGGAAVNGGGGGGGGGWYGGGGGGGVVPGGGAAAAGGGGSGFGDTLVAGVDAHNGGNGSVTLAYTVGDTSCVPVPVTPSPALVVQPRFSG